MSTRPFRAAVRSAASGALQPSRWLPIIAPMMFLGASVAFAAPHLHPFREPGRFTLQCWSATNTVILALLAVAACLGHRRIGRERWLPRDGGLELFRRHLGAWMGNGLLLVAVVAIQYGGSRVAGDHLQYDPRTERLADLAPEYVALAARAALAAAVLLSWAIFLSERARRSLAVLGVLILFLAGALFSQLRLPGSAGPILEALVPRLPSLGMDASSSVEWYALGREAAHCWLQVGAVLSLGAALADNDRGKAFESD